MSGLRDLTNLQECAGVGKSSSLGELAGTSMCYCKLLLERDEAAEALLFCSSNSLELLTDVTITLSPPDAEEVVVVLSGSIHSIHAALGFVAERLGCMRDAEFTSLLRRKVVTLRVVVPNSVVGVLMGRSGKDIRNLAVSCGVRIQISQRVPGVLERVVHITGTVAQVVLAAASVVETIQADPHTHEHAKRLLASLNQQTNNETEDEPENLVMHLQQLLDALALHPDLI
jgi:hypothetical protein